MVTSDGAQRKKRKRKYRKSTHAIIKILNVASGGERGTDTLEVEALTARLNELKTRAFGVQEKEEHDEQLCKQVENRLLWRAVSKQQDEFTAVHALVNEYSLTDIEAGSVLHQFIHLDKNASSRQRTLVHMNGDIISRGRHLLQRLKPQMHQPWRPMRNDHCFEASTGDYYASSFAIMPFKRFNTIQKAFEALIVYFTNLEISTSEKFGSVTIREDNDTFQSEVAQNRLVTTTQSGQQMESNTIFFSKLVENGDDAGYQSTGSLCAISSMKMITTLSIQIQEFEEISAQCWRSARMFVQSAHVRVTVWLEQWGNKKKW